MKNKTHWITEVFWVTSWRKVKWSARKLAVAMRHATTKRGGVNPNRGRWRFLNRMEPVPRNAQVALRCWKWNYTGYNTHWLSVRRFQSLIGRKFLTLNQDIRVPRD